MKFAFLIVLVILFDLFGVDLGVGGELLKGVGQIFDLDLERFFKSFFVAFVEFFAVFVGEFDLRNEVSDR